MVEMKSLVKTRFDKVGFTPKEKRIFMPNEIFDDFKSGFDSGVHKAFAYSYYYVVNYLYRYTKYSFGERFTQPEIMEFLGYSASNKKLNYITKKDGLLDQIGYTKTTTDYPVQWNFDSDYAGKSLEFV